MPPWALAHLPENGAESPADNELHIDVYLARHYIPSRLVPHSYVQNTHGRQMKESGHGVCQLYVFCLFHPRPK